MASWLPWWIRWWRICLQCRRPRFSPWIRMIPWRGKWQPTPVILPGKLHGQRSLEGYSPWGHKESDRTGWFSLHLRKLKLLNIVCKVYMVWLLPLQSVPQAHLNIFISHKFQAFTCYSLWLDYSLTSLSFSILIISLTHFYLCLSTFYPFFTFKIRSCFLWHLSLTP